LKHKEDVMINLEGIDLSVISHDIIGSVLILVGEY
jgi:hypothetical protein